MSSIDFSLYSLGISCFLVSISLSFKIILEILTRNNFQNKTQKSNYVQIDLSESDHLEKKLEELKSIRFGKNLSTLDQNIKKSKIFNSQKRK